MEIRLNFNSKNFLLWIGLFTLMFVLLSFIAFVSTASGSGPGMVAAGLIYLLQTTSYLFIIILVGACRDAYTWKEKAKKGTPVIDRFTWTISSATIYLIIILAIASYLLNT